MNQNPFVGPRSFERQDANNFFGRQREVNIIVDLMIAERIVLLYSPSGAGKTSLLQAAVIPQLEQNFFQVLPIIRVNTSLPGSSSGNRYLTSAMLSLEEGVPKEARLGLDQINAMTLQEYLAHYKERLKVPGSETNTDGEERWDEVLIFDQFEEILTLDPAGVEEKILFFRDVGAALTDPHRWALFAMREEFEPGLDPFKYLLPTRFRTRYRLELLGEVAAKQAIQLPSQAAGVRCTDEAAASIVDDLRRISVQLPDGSREQRLGQVVEPVQLQVVCRRLWADLPEGQSEITSEAITSLQDVDTALAGYYAEQVQQVAATITIPERLIRRWFEQELITEFGLRGQVLKEPGSSAGLDNRAINLLIDSHIVRAEHRLEATWFELAHDRLIGPIKKDNGIWHEAHLSLLQRQAELWDQQQRPEGLLLREEALQVAEAWAITHPEDVTATETLFLDQSLMARVRARRAARQNRLIRILALTLALAAIGIGAVAHRLWVKARPWGTLTNLSSGRVHKLSGDAAMIGRNTEGITNQVNLLYLSVSRLHLRIQRDHKTIDLRSLQGSSVNGEWLRYGETRPLEPGDILTLAGTAAFRFKPIAYNPWQVWPAFVPSGKPSEGWGLLIDDVHREVHPLSRDRYYLSVGRDGRLTPSATKPTDRATLAVIQVERNAGMFVEETPEGNTETFYPFSIMDLDDGRPLFAVMKTGSTYTYLRCLLPPGQPFTSIQWKTLPGCKKLAGRGDFSEDDIPEVSIMNVSFVSGNEKSLRFQLLPALKGLEATP
ncbi:MAG: FHA domain-containing protein [Synechococcaceae cyanobacterium]|jgi:hypothetical protein